MEFEKMVEDAYRERKAQERQDVFLGVVDNARAAARKAEAEDPMLMWRWCHAGDTEAAPVQTVAPLQVESVESAAWQGFATGVCVTLATIAIPFILLIF